MKQFYITLAILGTVLPLWQFFPWVSQNGLDIPLFLNEAFASNLSAFAWLDVIVSAVVLIGFIFYEGRRLGMQKLWLPVAATLGVGVSLGLPLFLLMRQIKMEKEQA